MPTVVTIAANAVIAKLIDADDRAKDLVAEKLSYIVEGHAFMAAFNSGGWNGRSSFFSRRTHVFPAGFVHLVHATLIANGYAVRVVKKPLPDPLGPENPIVDEFGNDNPKYDYQIKALRQVEKHGRGIIQVATGGGKSKIAKLITARYQRMTLFLTTRGVLMYQMRDAFARDCKFNVGIIGDGEWSPTKGINCGMVQTLISQLAEPDLDAECRTVIAEYSKSGRKMSDRQLQAARAEGQQRYERKLRVRARTIKLLELFEVVIGEEAHEAGGNSYYEILQYCKNAKIRVALTATPFMRDDMQDNMRLQAAFGPVLIRVSEAMLIHRGILAKPYFKYVLSSPHDKLRKTSPWQRAYQLGYIENQNMHTDILRDALRARDYGLPVLTLVQRTKHETTLKELFAKNGLKVRFIRGENDQAERKAALDALAVGRIDALIGTTILDVGVDVPAVGLVQLAGGGKAEVNLRQRIGRGLRSKKSGPNIAFICDYSADINVALRDHTRQRRAIIEGTPGFAEGILPPATDFPWHLLQKRAA